MKFYNIMAELWICIRWLSLKLLFSMCQFFFGRTQKVERALIKIGNFVFRAQFSLSLFQNYGSYVSQYSCNFDPFLMLQEDRWLRDKTILDIGSGLGQYSVLLIENGAKKVVSLEYQYDKISWAFNHLYGTKNILFVNGSAEALPFKQDEFDSIFSHTVFEHINDIKSTLSSIKRVLKNNGLVILNFNYIHHRGGHHLFPYIHFPWAPWLISEKALCSYWSDCLSRDQKKGLMSFYPKDCNVAMLSDGDEIHLNKMNFDEFENIVKEAGFRIIERKTSEVIGQVFPFLKRIPKLKYFLSGTIFYVLARNEHRL